MEVKISVLGNDGRITPEDNASLQTFIEGDRFIHYVCMASRPGAQECLTLLEHRDYNPQTERNELFIMRVIEWQDLLWFLVSIPIEEKELMENATQETGLRIANGVPMMFGESISAFPAQNERVFTLENVSGHPTYQNRKTVDDALRKDGIESSRRIIEKYSKE